MLGRIGYRRVLPISITLLQILISILASTNQQGIRRAWNALRFPEYRTVAFQEDAGTVHFVPMTPVSSPEFKAAMLLNLPAICVAAIVGALSGLHPEGDAEILWISVLFVPLVWYPIGRWIDIRLGLVKRTLKPDSSLRRSGRRLSCGVAGALLVVSLTGTTPLYHHNTRETYWVWTAMILWSSMALGFAISANRQRGASPQDKLSRAKSGL
jgi:hypothetical protein